MGVLQKIAMGFLDGWNNADRGKQKYKPYKPSEIDLRRYDRDFEFRLMRARTEPMEVLEYSNEADTGVKRECEAEDCLTAELFLNSVCWPERVTGSNHKTKKG